MSVHAPLSPSSASRWLTCPASVSLIAALPQGDESESPWAAEGTRAHSVAELEASHALKRLTNRQYGARTRVLRAESAKFGDDFESMQTHGREYASLVLDAQADLGVEAQVLLEQRLQTSIPDCWGTGDAVVVGLNEIRVVDYKYGQGVKVDVENNPQLLLYALGAYETFGVLGAIETIGLTVHQPRISGVSSISLPVGALEEWRDTVVLPAVARLVEEPDTFGPSETACRWCPLAGSCRARKKHIVERELAEPDLLEWTEIADAFRTLAEIRDWCAAVEKEALRRGYRENEVLPGLKVVLSGGRRSINDHTAAIEVLTAAGYAQDQVSRLSTRTLGDLEKLVGANQLSELLGDLLVKSPGSPAIVAESDPRPAVSALTAAREEFSTLVEG